MTGYTLLIITIICLIPMSVGILLLRGFKFPSFSFGDWFERRHLAIKWVIVLVIAIPGAYIILFTVSWFSARGEDRFYENKNIKETNYQAILKDIQQYIDIGDNDLALYFSNQAINLQPTEAKAYEMKANILSNKGNYSDALLNVNKEISLDIDSDPTNLHPYELQGYILDSLGNHELAVDSYQKAIQRNPLNYYLYEYLAQEQNLSGKYNEALFSISMYLRNDNDNPAAYIDRGISYYWLNQCQEAMINIRHASSLLAKDESFDDYLTSSTLALFDTTIKDAKRFVNTDYCINEVK